MHVWIVTPAYRRYAVTRATLLQRQHAASAAGVTVQTVVIADDKNLDIARRFGCHTIRKGGPLGGKLNEGIDYALKMDADWVCFAGCDDWLHESLFDSLGSPGHAVVETRQCAMVNLLDVQLTGCPLAAVDTMKWWMPPWFIPRTVLAHGMVPPELTRGMEAFLDMSIRRNGGRHTAEEIDPWLKVEFKDGHGITSYQVLRASGLGQQEQPSIPHLQRLYPEDAVEEILYAHRTLIAEDKVQVKA